MKKRPKRQYGIADLMRFSLGAAILVVFAGGLVFSVAMPREEAISAVGVMVCGKPAGVVVIQRDGKQVYKEVTDPSLLPLLKKLPEEQKGVLKAGGAYCFPPKPQVY